MPINNGPLPPANPYDGGNINLDSSKEPKTPQVAENTTSASTIAEVTTSTPPLNEKKTNLYNFSSDDPIALGTIFKNNTKKPLAKIFALIIIILSAILLWHFKYIVNISTTSFIIATATIFILFLTVATIFIFYTAIATIFIFYIAFAMIFILCIAIATIFKIIKRISIMLHKVVSIRKGKTYTGAEKSLHYIIFTLIPTLAIFAVALFVLGVDTFSTTLYDRHAYRTTPTLLKEFFNDPDIGFVLLIFLALSIAANLSSTTSIIIIIEEILKNKRRQKAKRIILDPEEKSTRSTIISHIKLVLPLLPLTASIVFMLALIHNTQVTKGNLSTAIQITAIQFTDSKYIWLTMAFSLLLIGYISFIPYFLLPQCVNGAEKIILRGRKENIKREVECIYFMIISISSALTFFCALINYQILKILSHKEIIIFLLTAIFISFTLCNVSLRNILDKKYELKSTTEIRSRTREENRTALIMTTLSVILISSISSWLIPNITKGFSDIVTSPGDTLGSVETDYSCVFSNDIKEKKSIAFGVIAESKPESVHIFTPEYNQERNSYGEEVENGKVIPNKLAESQVKIPGGYRIEKFDGSKHGYNLHTGKCEYVQTRYSLKEIFYAEYIENSKKPPHK